MLKSKSRVLRFTLPYVFTVFISLSAQAEELFYSVPLKSLEYLDSKPKLQNRYRATYDRKVQSWADSIIDRVILNNGAEAYLWCDDQRTTSNNLSCSEGKLVARLSKKEEISGRILYFDFQTNQPILKASRIKPILFDPSEEAKNDFYLAREQYFSRLQKAQLPGAAWFRHQVQESRKNRKVEPSKTSTTTTSFSGQRRPPQRQSSLEDSYDLFSGGRALSENLQLDRSLDLLNAGQELVDISTISGITIDPFDWKSKLQGSKPDLDPLATMIPQDQYGLFFQSLPKMLDLMDQIQKNGDDLLPTLEVRSEDVSVRTRYQNQLCLPLSELTKKLGEFVISEAAITGSDPYFRTGTDVAILFSSSHPTALATYLAYQRQKTSSTSTTGAIEKEDTFQEIKYWSAVSSDRQISSYLAIIGNVVIVSNSKQLLERIIKTTSNKSQSMASSDEYSYFRLRYPRSDNLETGFLMITDAAIRKWAGPKWRIADSRRTRAAAQLSELQAEHMDNILSGTLNKTAQPVTSDTEFGIPGSTNISTAGIYNSVYGSLDFLTPISELEIDKVSSAENNAYVRFRDTYSSYWKTYFDPIAISFRLNPELIGIDLSVMPLIASTDYRFAMDLIKGAALDQSSGDFHPEALLNLILAVDTNSAYLAQGDPWTRMMLPTVSNPWGWIGKSIALYLDHASFWEEVRKSDEKEKYMEKNYHQIPIGVHIEVQDSLKLTAFLTAIRAMAEQSSPGLTQWSTLEYKGVPYVKVEEGTPTTTANRNLRQKTPWAIYYASTPEALLLSLSEEVLKRAIDRRQNKPATSTESQKLFFSGSSIGLQLETQFIDILSQFTADHYETLVKARCWNNIPILNYWKKLYPDKDPVSVHQQIWKTKLTCPAGGEYIWNEEWQTMESTAVGHHIQPKSPQMTIPLANDAHSASFALSFIEQGLRAKLEIRRKPGN